MQSMEEANSESRKKAYCDTELATNKATRGNKQSEVDELAAAVDKHVAEGTQLGEELAFLAEALGHLRQEQSEATKIRSERRPRTSRRSLMPRLLRSPWSVPLRS